jgi:hypothetical protein
MFNYSKLSLLPEGYNILPKFSGYPECKIRYQDFGGAGDCLLRCFIRFLGPLGIPVSRTQEYYEALGKDFNVFLEDDSLVRLLEHYSLNSVIFRISSESTDVSFFDNGSDRTIVLVNFYPYHYCLVTKVEVNIDGWVDVTQNCQLYVSVYHNPAMLLLDEVDVHPQVLVEGYKLAPSFLYEYRHAPIQDREDSESSQDSEVLSESASEPENLTYSIPGDSENHAQLYAFFCDSADMTFPDLRVLLESFYHVHNIFVRSLSLLSDSHYIIHHSYLDLYFKFRHNVFATMCKYLIGCDPCPLDTDMPLSKYLADSKKTPDFIVETENEIKIFEFTVGNNYARVDYVKGGGNFEVKYTSEAKEIEGLMSKKVSVRIVPAVLDEYNISEIEQILDIQPTRHVREFFDIANTERWLISKSYVKSWSGEKLPGINPPGLVSYDRPGEQQVVLFPHDVLSALTTGRYAMMSKLESLATARSLFVVYFDVATLIYRSERHKNGRSLETWLSALSGSLSDLIPLLKFKENGKDIALNKIRGTVPITVNYQDKPIRMSPWLSQPSFDSLYLSTVPKKKPGFNHPDSFDDTMLLSKSDLPTVNFSPDYFEKLCNIDTEKLLASNTQKMLGNCEMNLEQVNCAVALYTESLKVANNIDTFRAKPSFMFGLITVPIETKEVSVPDDLCRAYINHGSGKYTKAVLTKAMSGSFARTNKPEYSKEISDCYQHLHSANSAYYLKMQMLMGKTVKYSALSEEVREELNDEFKTLSKFRREYMNLLRKSKSLIQERTVRIQCNGVNKQHLEEEMKHYNRNEGLSGVGILQDSDEATSYFLKLCYRLMSPEFVNYEPRPPYEPPNDLGSDFLKTIKCQYHDRWETLWKRIGTSMLFQNTNYYERLAKFLFNESLKTYNRDYVKIDNLGLSDVLVMVRGGSKLYKHQRSHLYRVMFPVSIDDLKFSGYLENDAFEVITYQSKTFVMSPWSQVHQDILFDYMFATPRIFNQVFSVYSRVDPTLKSEIPPLAILPAIMMFHNRRKTEKFLHNSRYLIVNPLGKWANLTGIIESFCDTNHTWVDAWLRSRIQNGYARFAGRLIEVRDSKKTRLHQILDEFAIADLWLGSPLYSPDLLTLFIYSTYTMTKAPVNSSIEQVTNLWEILDDVKKFEIVHPDVDGINDVSLRMDVTQFDPDVYSDDFKYDPAYCQYLGHYMQNYLGSSISKIELHNKWENLLDSDLDSIANSNGLRGFNKMNFFNKKGYEVVYDKVNELISNKQIMERVDLYLKSSQTEASMAIKGDRLKLRDTDKKFEKLVFHIVHKIQRGGNREIFCMDMNTKSLQNPIESLFAFICKRVPNEFISIPSSKRHSKIHADFYEKSVSKWVKKVIRWVLDCRRWAPHSVFQKYLHFVHGLSPLLPSGFVKYFYDFAEGMFKKQFVTREHVLSKMRSNKRFEPYKDLLKPMELVADAFSMTVKFSFVMGIFNYLSTLMHAANQLVASEVIRQVNLNKGYGLVILDAKCHSDDSVVSSYHESDASVSLSVKLYDWLLKGANHMLSVKKSQVNEDVYLEFLSTLYVFDRFLPVYPKFISTIPFKPSDQGFYSDITFAASQAIEMLTMGGSMEESYLIMKTTDKAIRQIYNIPTLKGLPPQLFGPMDAHPLELLISGSEADLYNFFNYKNEDFWVIYNLLSKYGLVKLESGKFTFSWNMGAQLDNKIVKKLDILKPVVEKIKGAEWTLNNCKLGNSSLNLIWYYLKMHDRKFRSSLVDEPVARRMARIFGAGGYRLVETKTGTTPVSHVIGVLQEAEIERNTEQDVPVYDFLTFMSQSQKHLHNSLVGAVIHSCEASNLKEKPILFTSDTPRVGGGQLQPSEYVSYKKEPDGYKLLGKFSNPIREVSRIDQELRILGIDADEMSPDLLYPIVRKMVGRSSHSYRMIAAVPSGNRIFNTYTSYVTYLESASLARLKGKIVSKAASILDWEMKLAAGRVPDVAKEYIKIWWTCSVLADYKILDVDLYNVPPRQLEKECADRLPNEWKMILLTSLEQQSFPLSDINHWIYWEKPQLRLGTQWVGSGSCIVKVPEGSIRVTMAGGSCISVQIFTDHTGMFSQSSSWYLHNVLVNSAVNAQFFDPILASPNRMYLGVNNNSSMYGYGRANNFDMVLDVIILDEAPYPLEFKTKLAYKKQKNHFEYLGQSKSYYIDFFVPVDNPVQISFKGFFDMQKIRENASDPYLTAFIKDLAVDMAGFIEINQEDFIDKIGSSTLYHLLFDAPQRQSLINNEETQSYLVEAFVSWKKTHPDFGFPEEEELNLLLKDSEAPPFPKKVMDFLLSIGKTNMTDFEYQSLVLQLAQMPQDDRMSYLLSQYSYLDPNMKSGSLVIAAKTKLLYKSVALIGRNASRVLAPFLTLIESVIDKQELRIRHLEDMKNTIYYSTKVSYTGAQIFRHLSAKLFYDLIPAVIDPKTVKSVWHIKTCLEQAWPLGLGMYMNASSSSDPITRATDFNVDLDTISDFFDDLVFNMAQTHIRIEQTNSSRSLYKQLPQIYEAASSYHALMLKFSCYNLVSSIEIRTKKTKKILKKSEPKYGFVHDTFKPLDEDNQEEYRCCVATEDWEEADFLDEDDEPIPDVGFTNRFIGDFPSLASSRGGAWSMFIAVNHFSQDYKRVQNQNVSVYKKSRKFSSIFEYLEMDDSYIIYMGMDKTNVNISGYKKMIFENERYEVRNRYSYKRTLEVDGKKLSREEIIEDNSLRATLTTFDSFFNKVSAVAAEEAEIEIKKVYEVPQFKNEQLEEVLIRIRNAQKPQEVTDPEPPSFFDIFKAYQQALQNIGDESKLPLREFIRANYSSFHYQEPLKLLRDMVVRSELNVLIPGLVDELMNDNLQLSKATKSRIVKFAMLTIQTLPKMMKKKYNKLLFVIKVILSEIKTCNFLQNETFSLAAIIDNLFANACEIDSSSDDSLDLIPDSLTDNVTFDLEKLLQ